jgi:Arc/MetJ-type ribon-helix-helix transcriptional regulator
MSREISFRMPESMRERLDQTWPDSGRYTSRAEYIRHAVAEKLDREEEG